MRKVEIGQKIIGPFGYVNTVSKVGKDREGRDWVTIKAPDGVLSHWLLERFVEKFKDQLPKEKPKQGELM